MHICIFQTGEPLHIDKGNYRPMRAMLLADELLKKGHKVTLISSAFFHQRKTFRSIGFQSILVKKNLKIELIPSCGYKKNISLKRLFDHLILSINLYLFLKKNSQFHPDKIFIGYPPIETSFVIIRWAKKLNIPIMLDVKDNWPENFLEAFPKSFYKISKILLFPYFTMTKYIFRNVNSICSITESFISWIKLYSFKKAIKAYNVDIRYFVAPLVRKKINLSIRAAKKSYNFWKKKGVNIDKKKHFAFVGSISNSFNFNLILELAKLLVHKYPDYIFVICGTGEKFNEILNLFKDSPNILLIGEIDKYNALYLIKNSIATLAPYMNSLNFQNSIPNKIIESLEYGVPFITDTEGEMKEIIKKYKNGIFIKNKDFSEIIQLIENKDFLSKIKINALNSHEILFNFEENYGNIINEIINL